MKSVEILKIMKEKLIKIHNWNCFFYIEEKLILKQGRVFNCKKTA